MFENWHNDKQFGTWHNLREPQKQESPWVGLLVLVGFYAVIAAFAVMGWAVMK